LNLLIDWVELTVSRQFGNMLVLSATYHNEYLRALVDGNVLQEKLQRTIGFLRRLQGISPTSHIDCGILEKIHKTLFGVPEDQKHLYHNEGVEHSFAGDSMSATNSFSAST
jgi:hypothetical protein